MQSSPMFNCRACLTEVSIKDRVPFTWIEVRELFAQCSSIDDELLDDKSLPQQICIECHRKCEQWMSFRRMCLDVNEFLLKKNTTKSIRSTRKSVWVSKVELNNDPEAPSEEVTEAIEDDDPIAEATDDQDAMLESADEEDEENSRPSVHLARRTGRALTECPLCNVKSSDLDTHIMKEHTTVSQLHCPVCSKMFNSKRFIKRHLITHTGQRKFTCPECGQAFQRRYILEEHRQQKHFASIEDSKNIIIGN